MPRDEPPPLFREEADGVFVLTLRRPPDFVEGVTSSLGHRSPDVPPLSFTVDIPPA